MLVWLFAAVPFQKREAFLTSSANNTLVARALVDREI